MADEMHSLKCKLCDGREIASGPNLASVQEHFDRHMGKQHATSLKTDSDVAKTAAEDKPKNKRKEEASATV